MSRLGVLFLFSIGAGLLVSPASGAPVKEPDFREAYSVIESNLPAGMTRAELNSIALRSLLDALKSKVSLGSESSVAEGSSGVSVSKAEVIHKNFVYFRVNEVNGTLAQALEARFKQLAATNKIQGVVVDLRFAGGNDYSAAAAAADLFIAEEKPLLDTGKEVLKTSNPGAVVTLPVAILINHATREAAEALGATLRHTGTALLLGSRTAGLAALGREFPLSSGEKLRINLQHVQFPGGRAVAANGLPPDIAIDLTPEEEKVYYADPFAIILRTNLPASGTNVVFSSTNRVRRPRFSEADLVREHNEGRSDRTRRDEQDASAPSISDPALARALDLLKGLAVVRARGS